MPRAELFAGWRMFLERLAEHSQITDLIRPRVEAWGAASGCTRAIVESRAGWMKVLKPHGYEIFQVSVMKEL